MGFRSCVGRGTGFSAMRSLSETLFKPVWDRFPMEKWHLHQGDSMRLVHEKVTVNGYQGRTLRLVFLSDLHAGPTTSTTSLAAAFDLATELQPDAVLLGGDYVYYDAENIERISKPFRRLTAHIPAWGVWGNHDLWADDQYLARFMADHGVRMLTNEWEHQFLSQPIDLYGVDDPWTGNPNFSPLAHASQPVILLCHNPDGTLLMNDTHRADVMLCGHTHGGQICKPNGEPYLVHAKTGKRFAGGRYDFNGRDMLVSRGLGQVEVPLRRYAPPEVLLVELRGQSTTG